jgi:hypothetical protein
MIKSSLLFIAVSIFLNTSIFINNSNGQWVKGTGISDGSITDLVAGGNNIFAGRWDTPSGSGGVYLSTDNGLIWTKTAFSTSYNNDVTSLAVSGNNLFAGIAKYSLGLSGVFISTNNGANWTQTAMNDQYVKCLTVSGNYLFAGTQKNGVYYTTDNGANWTQTALNNRHVWCLTVSGNYLFAGTMDNGVYLSENNGTTWTQTALNDKSIQAIAVNGNYVFAGERTYGNGVYLSTNNGTTWTQTSLNNKHINDLLMNGNTVIAGTIYEGIYLSTDNGANWTQKNEGFYTKPTVNTLLISNNYLLSGTNNEAVWRRPLYEMEGGFIRWTGGTSTDWETSSNWFGNTVPSAGENVLISTGSAYMPVTSSNTTVGALVLQQSTSLTLGADFQVNRNLYLVSGLISQGDYDLTLGSSSIICGTPSAANMIIASGTGELRKTFTGTGSFTFPVGDNTGTAEYSPVTLNFTSGTFSDAYAGVNLSNVKQGNNTSSTDYLKRYWSISQNGISNFSCDVTLQYLTADVAGTEANLKTGRYIGGTWTLLNPANTVNHTLSGTVIGFSDFTGVEEGILLNDWVQMSNGIGNDKEIYAFAACGNNIYAAVGTAIYDEGVYLSTNNGVNWIQTALNDKGAISLAVNGNNVFAGTMGQGIYISTNNGTNWTQTSMNNKWVYAIVISGNNMFAGTASGGVYLSTNNGTDWAQTALKKPPVYSLAVSGDNLFAATENGIYLTTNNGTNWIQTALNNQRVSSLAVSGNNLFAGTYNNGIYLSTNNGTNWRQTSLNNEDVNAIAVCGNIILAGTTGHGVYLSTNNGIIWTQENQGFVSVPMVRALLITDNCVFAGTSWYSVWRRPLYYIEDDYAWWTGGTSMQWETSSNWASNTVPLPGQNVVISSNAYYMPVLGFSAAVGTLMLQSSSRLELEADLQVNGNLYLLSGLITLGNNNLTLGSSAVISGTPSAANMIVAAGTGELRKILKGTGSFTFPVGDNTGTAEYSPVTLNFTSGTFSGGAYAGVKLSNTKHVYNSSPKNFLNRFWSVSQNSISGFLCDVTLQYLPADVAGTETNIWTGKYNGGTWTLLNKANTVNHTLSGTVTGFSDFTGGEESALPVGLSSFTSLVSERNVLLKWTTFSEINNAGFEIQRAAAKSQPYITDEFKKTGYIKGQGTANTHTDYTFEDKKLSTGKYMYRLKQIDNNGNFEYHNLSATVEIGVPNRFNISQNYPNPFNPSTRIDFQLPIETNVLIAVYDITGREIEVLINNEHKKADFYTIVYNAGKLASGIYFYRIVTDKFVMTKKMVIVR